MPKTFKVGTRGSLLALTQCQQIVQELAEKTGDSFELEIIKTQGDLNTSVPLWQMEGQNFFTKELDQALIAKRVDMVVHSYKDLGSIRPDELEIAAITKRRYVQDILLIKKETVKKLTDLDTFTVGTSSPRRIANAPYLKNYLPGIKKDLKIQTKTLRGNVNTRIGKLQNGEYDAIILALAGIERLALSEKSKAELTPLLKGLDFMIMPLSNFPSAASQGALAIEVLKENTKLKEKLKVVQDENTVSEIKRERKAFNEYGGGCHLAVGINVKKVGPYYLHVHQGEFENKRLDLKKLERLEEIDLPKGLPYFLGMPSGPEQAVYDQLILKSPLIPKEKQNAHFYVTTSHALTAFAEIFDGGTVWAAGNGTMKKLAEKGYWVQGCADSLGDTAINQLKNSKAIQMMLKDLPWKVLTNVEGSSTVGEVIPSYTRKIVEVDSKFEKSILNCQIFFWASYYQYQQYVNQFPEIKDRYHACGLGKTLAQFEDKNIKVTPFSSFKEFLNYIKDENHG
ncbi:MAG: hydroxymethylbilane synthase [Deltaproteobacteria bacterium]|nr:MAG: hydroxymethylbilane synthase [Deltaproteobacteria bacterium]